MLEKQHRSRPRRNLLFASQFLLGLLILVALLYFINFNWTINLSSLNRTGILGIFICTFIIAISMGVRLSMIVNQLKGNAILSPLQSSQYFLLGRLLGFILPKDLSDFLIRSSLLQSKLHIDWAQSVGAVLIDRLMDVFIGVSFLFPAILFITQQITAPVAITLVCLFLLLFTSLFWIFDATLLHLLIDAYNYIRTQIHHIRKASTPLRLANKPVVTRRLLISTYFISLIKQLSIGFRAYFIGLALNIDLSAIQFIFSAPIAQLSYLIALTPGGLGIFEATWFGILKQFSLTENQIGSYLLMQRIFIIIFVFITTIILFSWAYLLDRLRKKEKSE